MLLHKYTVGALIKRDDISDPYQTWFTTQSTAVEKITDFLETYYMIVDFVL